MMNTQNRDLQVFNEQKYKQKIAQHILHYKTSIRLFWYHVVQMITLYLLNN